MSNCRICGKPLTNPVSILLGIGSVCRVKQKNGMLNEKTENMFAARSEYDWGVENNIVWIADAGGDKSVTNDIENVIKDIIAEEGKGFFTDKEVMYKDSQGIWDGIDFTLNEGRVTNVRFFSINETDFFQAIKVLKSKQQLADV